MDADPSASALSDAEFLRFAAAAIAAPSADNSQPWLLEQHPEGIVVGLRPGREPMFFDVGGWASRMSLGAAVENVLQVAPGMGLAAEVVSATTPDADRIQLRMTRQRGLGAGPYEAAVWTRHTHRFRFDARGVPDALAPQLERAIETLPRFRLHWAATPTSRAELIRAVQLADHVRYTHPAIHRDFHRCLRFGAAQDRLNDGLAADTLGIERALLPALRLQRPWVVANTSNLLGLHHVMVWRGTTVPLTQAPLLGVLSSDHDDAGFDSGRALERLWLAAESAGLAFQPFGSLPLLLRRLTVARGEGLSDRHQDLLTRADAGWRRAVGAGTRKLVMVVRLGYAAGACPRARRRPVDSFLG